MRPPKSVRLGNRSIGVNLADFSRYFVGTSLQMPPLRGLVFFVPCCYKHAVPYGTEESFEVFKVSA